MSERRTTYYCPKCEKAVEPKIQMKGSENDGLYCPTCGEEVEVRSE